MIQSVSSSLAAQDEKREKNPPAPPEIAKMWTIFFGAAIPPSPTSVDDKPRTFAIPSYKLSLVKGSGSCPIIFQVKGTISVWPLLSSLSTNFHLKVID